ncbi:UDP-4-amino-4,6-dideoxy-N-acetyl-beta-L-altrosamine transaminase [bacterium]|nr:UDP-4-amino-4,6-dideoxy-N-acetyl-beta-L-altrosamine transaminase [bacterium]
MFIHQYGRHNINKKDKQAVLGTLASDFLTQGPKVREFEDALARYAGAKYAVAVGSGTAGLHLAYLAAGIDNGDEIITTPNTFVATTNMMLAMGARPVFADIRADTWNIDENDIEKRVTKKTKAIVPVHFAGNPCAMDAITKIARKHNLIVIEDACHALGASYKGKKIGGLGTDMSVFSFHPVKPITTGEGGAVLTNNKKYYDRLILLRSHGVTKNKKGENVMNELGYNYRLSDLQAALGISQLQKLNHFIAQRRKVAGWYKKHFSIISEIQLPKETEGAMSGWHLYVIRVNSRKRGALQTFLQKNGIGVNYHYPPVYGHPYYQKIGFRAIKLNNMEDYRRTCITLPCHTFLSEKDIIFIASIIRTCLETSFRLKIS